MSASVPLREVPPVGTDSDANSSAALLYECHPLYVLPELAAEIGIKEAIFLQQLHYWSEWKRARGLDVQGGRVWVWNSHSQWCRDMPYLTPRTVGRLVARIKKRKLIDVIQPNKSQGDCTSWYSINDTQFKKLSEKLTKKAAKSKEEREKQRHGARGKPCLTLLPLWYEG